MVIAFRYMHAYLIRDMEQSSFPARVPLVTEPMTLYNKQAARRNVLSIFQTSQPASLWCLAKPANGGIWRCSQMPCDGCCWKS